MTQYCTEYRYCDDCRDERPFEQVSAADGPDWVCTGCGAALIIGLLIPGYSSGDSVSQAA